MLLLLPAKISRSFQQSCSPANECLNFVARGCLFPGAGICICHIEFNEIPVGLFLQVPLHSSRAWSGIECFSQFGVICRNDESAFSWSLTRMSNKTGSRIDPCAILHVAYLEAEYDPLTINF